MEKKQEISEYRERLNKTLASPDLTNEQTLKALIKTQLIEECNVDILDKKVADLSKILEKLRSVSTKDQDLSKSSNETSYGDWKVKHDHEDCRVMYREGLEGSPFHTLLVEGYMDGPIQDCLCVSWEATLYQKWWPQFVFPPFRILKSTCLQKVGIGEQICLARMKVPWPLTDREIIVHYFFFEYFKDGLVVILLNSISDLDSIGVSSTDAVIPESPDAVRIDLVGGFVLQKVTPQRSYFRTIADMDIKMDLIPPSLINFISRQLIGNGFRLYKKSVASVAKFDEDYSIALADPLYTKIRRALYSTDDKEIEEETKLELVNEVNGNYLPEKEHEDASETEHVHCRRAVTEIEEEKEKDFEESVSSDDGNVVYKSDTDMRRRFCISPEVEQALGTLEKVIYMVRNITPVQEAGEMSPNRAAEDQAKQVSLLEKIVESVPQRSQRQDFSTSTITQAEKREKETGQENGILNKGKKPSLHKKRMARCFAFRSWL
uniref:START domain-containing protein n=1 Tax=Noccaea caerulescens TaxID=107243 RepID=A0A1J3D4T0_NOCCA